MKKDEVLREVMTAIEKKNWDTVEKNLTDDFTFSGAVPTPIGRKEWIGVHRTLSKGFPDLRMNLHDVNTREDKVAAKVRLSGTHTAELPPVTPGSKAYAPHGEKVQLPEEEVEISFRGDKISRYYVKPVAHGGVQGLIEQVEEAQKEKAM